LAAKVLLVMVLEVSRRLVPVWHLAARLQSTMAEAEDRGPTAEPSARPMVSLY